MYLKIQVQSQYVGTEEYFLYPVEDDFNKLPAEEQSDIIYELEQEAIQEYVREVDTEVCEGEPEDDEDY